MSKKIGTCKHKKRSLFDPHKDRERKGQRKRERERICVDVIQVYVIAVTLEISKMHVTKRQIL